jgi:hypothetical protein
MLQASAGKDPAGCSAVGNAKFEEKLEKLKEESEKSIEKNSKKKKK